eukprot:m.78130 g.78130  ORF g.78130 m.78130 type:complete len:126 (+) comp20724_c0_seq9:536-913(+)
MQEMKRWNKLVPKYSSQADFIVIYIEEAHAVDEWHVGGDNPQIAQHKRLEDRLTAAQSLVDLGSPVCPVMVDTMRNQANYGYGALYERLYVIENNKIAMQGAPGPDGYDISDVSQWLEERFNSQQ